MEESLKYQISRDNLWREILPPQESSAKYTTFIETIIAINVRNFILKLCMERNAQFLVLCNKPKSGASWSYTSFPNTKKNYHRLISLITVILSFLIKKFLRKFDIHLFFLFFFYFFFYFLLFSFFVNISENLRVKQNTKFVFPSNFVENNFFSIDKVVIIRGVFRNRPNN